MDNAMSAREIVEENTGLSVSETILESAETETYIYRMEDGRIYYANNEFAGFVNETAEDLLREFNAAMADSEPDAE